MRHILLSAAVVLTISLSVWADRSPPAPVKPVVHEGIRYVVPNDNGRRGYVQAWEVKSGKLLWEKILFTVAIDRGVEEDVQWVFIKAIQVSDNTLIVTDENSDVYCLDLKTGETPTPPVEIVAWPFQAWKEKEAGSPRKDKSAGSFQKGRPVVGTTYFYWYDVESKAHIVNSDGSDALTDHPAEMKGVSYKSIAWHKAQLKDMMDAGIDFLMPVYWGVPGKEEGWSFVGLPPLVTAHAALEREGLKPPKIGMFFDTSILQWNESNSDGSNYHVDLTTEEGKAWFYEAIRDFFSRIPQTKWARVEGRPIVFLYEAAFARKQDPQRQFEYVKKQFQRYFGVEPYLVKSSGWEGQADAVYSWGGAVNGPILYRDVAALGPGYDHRAVPGRQPLVVERQDGRTYIDRWTKVLQLDPKARPWMVHVETWNEWHEGTDVAHSREYGRSYIVLTRLFADLWHAGTHLTLPSSYINAREVSWQPDKPQGLDLRPTGGDGNWELRKVDNERAAVTLPNPHSPGARYLYFNIDDGFGYGLLGKPVLVRIIYRDAGCSSFAVEYDSTVNEGPHEGAFRPAGSTTIAQTGQWKTAEFRLPDCCFMNRCNGADFRLIATGQSMELAVSQVKVQKVD